MADEQGKAKKKGQGEELLPQFPALSKCLLIDPSFRSRGEVLKDLTASGLFEDVVVPKSLDEGWKMIKAHSFDACYLGPSLSREKGLNFLARAKESEFSHDTAFVCIARPVQGEGGSLYSDEQVHGQINWPCTKRAFFEGSVIAILRANKGTMWEGVKLSSDGKGLVFENGREEIKLQAKKHQYLHVDSLPDVEEEFENDDPLGKGPVDIRTNLRDFFFGTDDKQSTPLSPEIQQALEKMIAEGLSPVEAGTGEASKFLANAVLEWLSDIETLTKKDAMERLKKRLISYKPGEG